MTTVRCPRCHDEVTLPARAGKKTHVRCPLCLEDYLLDEALRQAPPVLEVIGGELEPLPAGVPTTSYAEVNDLEAGLTPAGGDGGFALAPQATDGVFGTMGPGASEAAVAPAGGVRASTRPKRKPKSAIGTMLGVVLGGGLGVALAPIAIWWIGGTDPFDLAPKVPAALRFVLPARLRAQVEGTAVASNPGNPAVNTQRPVTPPNNTNTQLPDGATIPGEAPSIAKNTDSMPADPLAPNVDPLPGTTPDENPEPMPPPAVAEVKPATNNVDEPPTNDRKATELLAALVSANDAAENFAAADPADKEVRKKLAVDLYEAACQLGPLARDLNLDNAALASAKERVQSFLLSQSGSASQINMLGFLASKRIDEPTSPPGILLSGKVTGMEVAGKAFVVTLAVGKAMREVVVITNQNPQDVCNVDDTVVVLGAIERDPSQVKGYEGPAEVVVVSGHLQKVE